MMTREENDLLCRVEGDAPMGRIMRRHWIAACLSEEVSPDGAPLKVRLLGEDLVVFRDSAGRIGVLDEYCSHRRASLACSPPATRNAGCAVSITAGSSTWRATCWKMASGASPTAASRSGSSTRPIRCARPAASVWALYGAAA